MQPRWSLGAPGVSSISVPNGWSKALVNSVLPVLHLTWLRQGFGDDDDVHFNVKKLTQLTNFFIHIHFSENSVRLSCADMLQLNLHMQVPNDIVICDWVGMCIQWIW